MNNIERCKTADRRNVIGGVEAGCWPGLLCADFDQPGDEPVAVFGCQVRVGERTVGVHRFLPFHTGKGCGFLECRHEVGQVMSHLLVIDVRTRTCGEGQQEFLAMQGGTAAAIGEPVFEDVFDPLLQQGGNVIPVDGELQNNDIGVDQGFLFSFGIDVEVGVQLVETTNLKDVTIELVFETLQNGGVHVGPIEMWVTGNNENLTHVFFLIYRCFL